MVFEHIIKLQQEYTDKFVVVDQGVPELSRFEGMTGTVRTVNMSGRALVEFDGNLNIGWYDIDLDFLKVIDAPLPKEDPKAKTKASPKAAAKKKKAPPPKPEAAGKGSVSDVLAAARGEKTSVKAAPAKPTGGAKTSVAEILATARRKKSGGASSAATVPKAASPKATAKDARKMSVDEMLAAARGEKSGEAAATAEAPNDESAPAKEAVRITLESARRTQAPAKSAPAAGSSAPAQVDRKNMSVQEMLAAARAEKSGGAPATAEEAVAAPEPPAPTEPIAEEPAAEEPAAETAAGGDSVSKRDEITAVEDQIAYCRQVDG
ncbi:MAG: hypothetical protein QF918_14970 [Pirellulaceae bacterium]|jgi:hypothetical protein|nr:hypothetical protein [Pirellulaceae bacterium]MDP6553268.1 hypothetical protein [Pirellulaceae bacterium]